MQNIKMNMLVILNLRLKNGAEKNSAEEEETWFQLLQKMTGK